MPGIQIDLFFSLKEISRKADIINQILRHCKCFAVLPCSEFYKPHIRIFLINIYHILIFFKIIYYPYMRKFLIFEHGIWITDHTSSAVSFIKNSIFLYQIIFHILRIGIPKRIFIFISANLLLIFLRKTFNSH